LIEIFVPLADGSGAGRIGTGIPIAKDRILTAGHVLLEASLDLHADFEVRWHHWRTSGKAPGEWTKVKRTQILYPPAQTGFGALDAAVFAHSFPAEVARCWCELTARNHATGTPWESEGFPDIGQREDHTRVAVPLRGQTYQCANRAQEAWLDVAAPAAKPEDWQGASGCPVMVCARVAGLLTKVPPGFGGGRVMALPIWRLLQEPDFRSAIGYRAGGDRIGALQAELERALRKTPFAVGALECLVDGQPEGHLYRDPARSVGPLAQALAAHDAVHMLVHARKAIRVLKSDHPRDARALADLVQRLLPILYDHTVVDGLAAQVADPGAVLIGFPVATRCVAEVVLAGAGHRETRYRPPAPDAELEGVLSLPRAPNSGIDPDGRRTADSFAAHLRRKLAVTDPGAFESAFCHCMREFVPATLRAKHGMDDDSVLRMAAKQLEDLAGEDSGSNRYYYLFELPPESEARTACVKTIRLLKARFPAVAFLELADDPALTLGEYGDFLPLIQILQALED
jgi:hypothetical protein